MTIHLKPDLEAMLKTQVDLGRYPSIEAALEAAVRQFVALEAGPDDLGGEPSEAEDLSWAKPLLEEADRDFEEGRVVSHDEVWSSVLNRLGEGKR